MLFTFLKSQWPLAPYSLLQNLCMLLIPTTHTDVIIAPHTHTHIPIVKLSKYPFVGPKRFKISHGNNMLKHGIVESSSCFFLKIQMVSHMKPRIQESGINQNKYKKKKKKT